MCALIGGVLIGISTSLNLYLFKRITGMSGMFNSIIKFDLATGFMWKFFAFVGLITIPFLTYHYKGGIV